MLPPPKLQKIVNEVETEERRMDYTGQRVKHATLGEGIIVAQDNDRHHIKIRFASKESLFSFPDCFKSHLTLMDSLAMRRAKEEIASREEEKQRAEEKSAYEAKLKHLESRARAMASGKSPALPQYSNYDAFFADHERAIIEEMMYLKTNGEKRIRLLNGVLVERKGALCIYSFESETELNYPDSTQITLWRDANGVTATLLSCEEMTVFLAVEEYIGSNIASIEFTAEPWILLQFLTERLKALREAPPSIVKSLILEGKANVCFGKAIVTGQDKACKMAFSQPITFIWGPPGTGKTHTLAQIALQHIAQNRRVLMLSHSNVSVDGAALRTLQLDARPCPGKIVRYGYPRDKELLEHPFLSSYSLTLRQHSALSAERKALMSEKSRLDRTDRRSLEISRRLREIRLQLADEEKNAVQRASFVATTVSKAIADKTLYADKFDVVIFDEASMAYVPQVVFAASLAARNFICVGDFCQLPPIVQSSNTSILNRNIFDYCYIAAAVRQKHGHAWLCMLNIQRRMHPDIASFASQWMYGGLLLSDPNMENMRRPIAQAAPFAGRCMALADLSGMMSTCVKVTGESRINVLSALVAISLAAKAAEKHDVGVITPYHAQSRLLHALSMDIAEAYPQLHKITCATVHQFQGSEQEVVLYDAVDCYRMKYPGVLLTSTQNDSANRLFNVAMSRTKGKFIVIANVSYLLNKELAQKLMFRNLIDILMSSASTLGSGNALKNETNGSVCPWFDNKADIGLYYTDLTAAKKDIRIDLPAAPAIQGAHMQCFLSAIDRAKAAGVSVYIRSADKAALPDELRRYAISNRFITNPVTVIDKTITWFGQPPSTANFIADGKTLPTRYRPVIRFSGRRFSTALFGFLSMEHVVDDGGSNVQETEYGNFSSYVSGTMKCPRCGMPLLLRKGRKSRSPFIGCSGYPNCEYTSKVEPDMVESYFYADDPSGKKCPMDGSSLIAEEGYYGLYIHCCGISRHKFKLEDI